MHVNGLFSMVSMFAYDVLSCFIFPLPVFLARKTKTKTISYEKYEIVYYVSFSSNTFASDTILIEHDYFVFIVLMLCKRLFCCQYLS